MGGAGCDVDAVTYGNGRGRGAFCLRRRDFSIFPKGPMEGGCDGAMGICWELLLLSKRGAHTENNAVLWRRNLQRMGRPL